MSHVEAQKVAMEEIFNDFLHKIIWENAKTTAYEIEVDDIIAKSLSETYILNIVRVVAQEEIIEQINTMTSNKIFNKLSYQILSNDIVQFTVNDAQVT